MWRRDGVWAPAALGVAWVLSAVVQPAAGVITPEFQNAFPIDSVNWTEVTGGRISFVMFYAPWCGHCKEAMGGLDGLSEELKKNHSFVIGKVDCIATQNKDMCKRFGVKRFPTLKYFSEDTGARGSFYTGAKEQWKYKEFLETKYHKTCSMVNLELCPEKMQRELKQYTDMTPEERSTQMAALLEERTALDTKFNDDIAEIQKRYDELVTAKKEAVDALEQRISPLRRVVRGLQMIEREKKEQAEVEARRAAEMARRLADEDGSCSADNEDCAGEEDE